MSFRHHAIRHLACPERVFLLLLVCGASIGLLHLSSLSSPSLVPLSRPPLLSTLVLSRPSLSTPSPILSRPPLSCPLVSSPLSPPSSLVLLSRPPLSSSSLDLLSRPKGYRGLGGGHSLEPGCRRCPRRCTSCGDRSATRQSLDLASAVQIFLLPPHEHVGCCDWLGACGGRCQGPARELEAPKRPRRRKRCTSRGEASATSLLLLISSSRRV